MTHLVASVYGSVCPVGEGGSRLVYRDGNCRGGGIPGVRLDVEAAIVRVLLHGNGDGVAVAVGGEEHIVVIAARFVAVHPLEGEIECI
ncbi:hypothetical protein [Butyricimonas hominis]|uniref:Uncharacterized protein n=1 Tax=Butyricimonas hominis TaxID=2763032 RepID=A0ABR7D0T3_9BACT|nr:hypothetical protein [Butyricimonas hominis]MBC5621439.1 hypothetical protein [Butyricimonas hominis]